MVGGVAEEVEIAEDAQTDPGDIEPEPVSDDEIDLDLIVDSDTQACLSDNSFVFIKAQLNRCADTIFYGNTFPCPGKPLSPDVRIRTIF